MSKCVTGLIPRDGSAPTVGERPCGRPQVYASTPHLVRTESDVVDAEHAPDGTSQDRGTDVSPRPSDREDPPFVYGPGGSGVSTTFADADVVPTVWARPFAGVGNTLSDLLRGHAGVEGDAGDPQPYADLTDRTTAGAEGPFQSGRS